MRTAGARGAKGSTTTRWATSPTPTLPSRAAQEISWHAELEAVLASYELAGGGFKPGMSYGATDEFGHLAVENKVHVYDLHATILHQLNLDHEKLTYCFDGRDYRLTDVHGHVLKEILA